MSKHLVIIAGEESGDAHAAKLVRNLRQKNPDLKVTGIGGQHLLREGVELISDLAKHGVTGLTEILKHVSVIKKAFKAIKSHLSDTKPDLLLLVDYPGFNLRIAKYAKQTLGLHIVYYISPQIWAWKANRIHRIKAYVDKMAVILPFEKEIYQKAAVPVAFVGHPLIDKIPQKINILQLRKNFRLPLNQPIVAILPGSRQNEIENHLPVLATMITGLLATNPGLLFVIPVAETLDLKSFTQYLPNSQSIIYLKSQAIEAISLSDCVLVASGTASLESALLEKPMAIFYKTSKLTYTVGTKAIRVKYLGLCNLLANKMIVPEFIQDDFNALELSKEVNLLLTNIAYRTRMIGDLRAMKASLSTKAQDQSLECLVHDFLYN